MKKRIFSLLLALVMVIGFLPVSARAGELDNGLKYKVYENHVEITDYIGDATEVVIPAEIVGLPVTSIGYHAFYGCDSLTSIDLPVSITSIGDYAFEYCRSLTSIDLPDSITSIGDGAFDSCDSLTSIDLPDSITSIGDSAFKYCRSLTSIDLPDGITSISDSAFEYCRSLTGIDLPDSIISIGDDAFWWCTSLTSIDLPDSIISIGVRTFAACKSLTSIDLPDSITSIGNSAFGGCDSLTSIDLPDSITSIGDSAFYYCSSLTSIDLPDSITSIGDSAFYYCSSLTNIDLPDSITSIGDEAFYGCTSLTSIDLPDSITSIGAGAFYFCTSLTNIDLPDSITSIGAGAFYFCTGLTSIYFRGDAPKFGNEVFRDITATAYYPAGNPTWTESVMQDYGGTITWIPYNPNNPFTDIPAGSFYEAPVLWALENNITTGASETSFNPNGQCLRAQVVTFLHRAAENPEPTAINNPFTDVKSSDFFYKPVLWAVEEGITNGVSAEKFGSYDVCNRAAVVTFLWRAAGSPEPTSTTNPFTDVKTTDFFYKPVLWAIENGITNGVSATEFGPTADCNRAQVVTFLYRAYN